MGRCEDGLGTCFYRKKAGGLGVLWSFFECYRVFVGILLGFGEFYRVVKRSLGVS